MTRYLNLPDILFPNPLNYNFIPQGDYLSKKVELVIVEKGDMLLMHDTAGYSISMYSKFHSISPTPVYTMKMSSNGEYEMRCIKPKESLHHINEFWGPLKPLAV